MRPPVRWLAIVLALVGVLSLSACGGKKKEASVGSTTTTTVAASTTTTTQPVVPTAPVAIPSKQDGTSADGSGCAPPAGDSLPDGIWFGDLKAVDVAAGTLSLDLNCFFTGEAANHAATEDGSTDVPVPNDYWIRNKVHKVYVLPMVPNAAVFKLDQGGASTTLVSAGTGPAAASSMLAEFNNAWIGWIQVAGGKVIVVQQQFVP
jgi:hypothetical protein